MLRTYLAEFHPSIIGLTGSWEQIKDVCKKYRVYFSTPEGAVAGTDYLVDHSIYFYLMGEFIFLFLVCVGEGGGLAAYLCAAVVKTVVRGGRRREGEREEEEKRGQRSRAKRVGPGLIGSRSRRRFRGGDWKAA